MSVESSQLIKDLVAALEHDGPCSKKCIRCAKIRHAKSYLESKSLRERVVEAMAAGPWSTNDLAIYVDATVESVGSQLGHLRRGGIVKFDGEWVLGREDPEPLRNRGAMTRSQAGRLGGLARGRNRPEKGVNR